MVIYDGEAELFRYIYKINYLYIEEGFTLPIKLLELKFEAFL